MSLTYEQARDEILGRFRTQWNADTPAVTDDYSVPEVQWQGVRQSAPEDTASPWARVTVRHTDGDQATLGSSGSRLFSRDALVTVQIFVPVGEGLALADQLAKIAVDAFEGKKAGEVWFRRVRVNEVGPDGPWFQVNVVAEATYDERK